MTGRGFILTSAWLLASHAAVAEEAPCRVPGLSHEVRCGQVERPLDPVRPQGTKLTVHYVVVPAKARHKQPDPVLLLAGGPGQSAIDLAPGTLGLFARLNNRRDIVFIDQRGTGRSAPLRCEEPPHATLSDESDVELQITQLQRCRDALGARAPLTSIDDLRFFTTTIAMQDVEAVRRQIGADRLNLVGGSYGTRAGLDYLRQFPQHTRRVVLDGVAPPDMALPASMSRDGQAAFDALLASCEQDTRCAKRHPTLRTQWSQLLDSLPRNVSVPHPLTGTPETFVLTRQRLLGAVRGPLYAPALAAALPEAISEAAQGRLAALAGLNGMLSARRGPERTGGLFAGMHFSVVCAEDLPRLPQATDAPGRDFGDDTATFYRRACALWPQGAVPAAFYGVAPSPSPVLLLSGGLDPVTPPRHGDRMASLLGAKARHVVVPNAGHGVMSIGCMRDVLHRFIDATDDAQALAVDASCAAAIPRPPAFEPLTLPATGGTP
jgi:pimeloyl-ACP methyl ester carboxylesterase